MARRLRGVYLITPDCADTHYLLERTAKALSAGVALLQYRNKVASLGLRETQAGALQILCKGAGVSLIINDHIDLAERIGAAGVHLGGGDSRLEMARQRLGPDALIGASCYDSLERARTAVGLGASYVAFGTFAASPTKPDARRAPLSLLAEASSLGVPRVAIGGIGPDNVRVLVNAGADLVAVISSVYSAPDPAAAVRALAKAFHEFPGDSS
jgi:thiamine-phosphate pyrophosphorylase